MDVLFWVIAIIAFSALFGRIGFLMSRTLYAPRRAKVTPGWRVKVFPQGYRTTKDSKTGQQLKNAILIYLVKGDQEIPFSYVLTNDSRFEEKLDHYVMDAEQRAIVMNAHMLELGR